MSIAAVTSRVAELQALIASAATGTPATSFAGTLASASTSATPATATASAASLSSPLATTTSPDSLDSLDSTATSALPAGTPFGAEITASAKRNGIDPALLAGLIKQESGFNADARSGAGAVGLTQLMPATAAGLGVSDPTDPAQSIEGGAKYLAAQLKRFGGDTARALAAYNAGPGAVERFGGVPPYAETQNYVRAVQANAAHFRSAGATSTPSTV
jgi:soluble lytic murein transglycosylase-like protein